MCCWHGVEVPRRGPLLPPPSASCLLPASANWGFRCPGRKPLCKQPAWSRLINTKGMREREKMFLLANSQQFKLRIAVIPASLTERGVLFSKYLQHNKYYRSAVGKN